MMKIFGSFKTELGFLQNLQSLLFSRLLILMCWVKVWCVQEYRELNSRGLTPALGWEYHRQQMYAQSMHTPMGAPQQAYMQR